MINKIIQKVKLYRKLSLWQYLYLNYFCTQVIRTDNSRVLPYKGSVIELNQTAKIYLGGGDMEVGCDILKHSKAETRIRLRENAVWSCEGGCKISYGATVEILHDAVLESQYYTLNSNSTLIAAKRIRLGHDVMISRNVVIYDSDFHTITDHETKLTNPDKIVSIGDHVWLAANVVVLKGCTIGSNSIVAANTTVCKDVPENSIYRVGQVKCNYGSWTREHPKTIEKKGKKTI